MTTKEIADKLVVYNRDNDYASAYAELYSPSVVSVEHWGETQEFVGFDAIKKKGEQWMASVAEMHETITSDPLVADKSFAVTFTMDATFKERLVARA